MATRSLNEKILETFSVLDSLKHEKNFAIAFSGGKDSTILSILIYEWLRSRDMKGKRVIFVHNDTLSELDVLEGYARSFLEKICGLVKDSGN
jgi:3'-phosphoadenosine 5'-phosphosulfate sulfotransferase (PAPS reductase)/FAD synthetase